MTSLNKQVFYGVEQLFHQNKNRDKWSTQHFTLIVNPTRMGYFFQESSSKLNFKNDYHCISQDLNPGSLAHKPLAVLVDQLNAFAVAKYTRPPIQARVFSYHFFFQQRPILEFSSVGFCWICQGY